jgi:hypothetical protein
MKKSMEVLFLTALGLTLGACTQETPNGSSSANTYGSTSSVGDYSQWTIDGNDLDVIWQRISTTGEVEKVYTVGATCTAADADFGYRTCTFESFSCADGTVACTSEDNATGDFHVLEIPGVAIVVHMDGAGSGELHFGFSLDGAGCSTDVSGDYVYGRLNIGSDEVLGIYRVDSAFETVSHAGFGFSGTVTGTHALQYFTSGGGTDTLGDVGCTNGVRTRTFASGSGPATLRAMMTNSGMFILDFPSGQGGLVSYKTDAAATLADFAGKEWTGISFTDEGETRLLSATTAALTGSEVPLSRVAFLNDATDTSGNIKFTTLSGAPFNTPTDYTSATDLGGLNTAYPTVANFPGLFRITGINGNTTLFGMKFNNKVIAFGINYNDRDHDSNPGTPAVIRNTGNFILFER